MNDRPPIKVLFIAGAGRSGSTLIHNVLGQLDGYVAVGEIREIWRRGLMGNWLCGCGAAFSECDFWRRVLAAAFGGAAAVDAARLAELTEKFRIKHLPATVLPAARRRLLSRVGELMAALDRLYAAIHEVSGSRVIVDSSKNPSFGYLLHELPGLELYDLQLIRHPAAVAFSWQQRKPFQQGKSMPRKRPAESGGQWLARNLGVEYFIRPRSDHFAMMRYEDFIIEPESWLHSLTEWTGEASASRPFTADRAIHLTEPNHSVFGNETRFESGKVALRRDDRWLNQMSRRDVREVGAITWPLRPGYGYALSDPITRPGSRLVAAPWPNKPVPPDRAQRP